jgi:hypothetical protein
MLPRFNGGLRNSLEPQSSNLSPAKALCGAQARLNGSAFSFEPSAIGYSEYQT